MTSTDNTSKPLKTVEEILKAYAGIDDGKLNKRGFVGYNELEQAKADLYQLMLSLVGEDEGVVSADDIEDFDVHRLAVERTKIGRNKLRAELRQKLSEHFNGEGKV